MFSLYCLNTISPAGMAQLPEHYQVVARMEMADAVLVRSSPMANCPIPKGLLAVARAGAGVNNIPIDMLSQQGTVVFNTPGANARSVMELALCGMLLGSRDIIGGVAWVKSLHDDVAKQVEKGKSQFAGHEIYGKRLGVVGLGAIGGPLANAALSLGMEAWGYDPYISVEAAWHLSSGVRHVGTLEELFTSCDMISLHTPLLDSTRQMINAKTLSMMKDGVILINLARDELVDNVSLEAAIQSGKVKRYITDFPNEKTASMEGVIAIPHLGASTQEAENNCAKMAVKQLVDYLENGNIANSVNFPNCSMGVCTKAGRISVLHRNIPNAISNFTGAVAGENINISDLVNRSRGALAYTMLDTDAPVPASVVKKLERMDGVLRARVIR